MRLYKLAATLEVDSKALADVARAAGIANVNSVLRDLSETEAECVREFVAKHPEQVRRIAEEVRCRSQELARQDEAEKSQPEEQQYTVTPVDAGLLSGARGEKSVSVSRASSSLINAVASDMFRGFEHFAVIELGALFESCLYQIDATVEDSGLALAIRNNCDCGKVNPDLRWPLVRANRTRNDIVHRRPGRFPTPARIAEAKSAFASGILDLFVRHRMATKLLEHLADSNPEVLNALDQFFTLDD